MSSRTRMLLIHLTGIVIIITSLGYSIKTAELLQTRLVQLGMNESSAQEASLYFFPVVSVTFLVSVLSVIIFGPNDRKYCEEDNEPTEEISRSTCRCQFKVRVRVGLTVDDERWRCTKRHCGRLHHGGILTLYPP